MTNPSIDQTPSGNQPPSGEHSQSGQEQRERKKPGPKPKAPQVEVISDPEQRLDQLRMERRAEHCANMFDPLGERGALPMQEPKNRFDKGVENMVFHDPRATLYRDMLKAIDPERQPTGHDPIVYLALTGVPYETFVALLPWVRKSLDSTFSGPETVEATVWGVAPPRGQEVSAVLQHLAFSHEAISQGGKLIAEARLAIIKRTGALNLEAALYRAMNRLQSWNPQQVWAQANLHDVGAQVAANVYVDTVRTRISSKYHDSVRNLAAIAWNKDMIAPRDGRVAASILTPMELASSTLRAAVLNYTDAETLRGLQRDIRCWLSSGSTKKQIGQSLNRIVSSLGLQDSDPHRRFIEHVVKKSRSGVSGPELLQAAWGQVSSEFESHAVSDLLRIESGVLATIKLSSPPFRGNAEFFARDVVSASLRQFSQVCRHNLLWTMITNAGTFSFKAIHDRPAREIDAQAITAAVPVSRILAGVPYVERAKLVPGTR